MNDFEHSLQPDYSGRVVVVDDNPNVRQMMTLALRTAGFDVFEAATQIDLQRWLAYNQPDALVIDLQRPEADGLGLLARMRARPELRDVPILFLAGSDAEDFRYQAITAGADWFRLRPLGMIDLQNQVATMIESGRPARAPLRRAAVRRSRVAG